MVVVWCEGRWQWWLLLAAQPVSKRKPDLGGGVGADTPLCPSTHRKAKRKFSLLEAGQGWGWGPRSAWVPETL